MENRAVVVLLAFLLIAGFGASVNYSMNLEEKRKDMIAAQDKAKAAEENVGGLQRQIDGVQKDFDVAKAKLAKLDELFQAKAEADKAEAEYPALVAEYQETVRRVREAGVGLDVPQLKLPNGPLLMATKITKVTDTEVTFSHGAGLSRVAVTDLPPDLQDGFRYDDPLMKSSVAAPPKPPSMPAVAAVSQAVRVNSNVNQEKLALLRKKLSEALTLQAQAEAAAIQWNTKIGTIQAKHASNNAMGRSDSSAAELQAAQKGSAQNQAQLNALNLQVSALRADLNAAMQGQ